jgi:putative ABC transport system permease protein
MSTATVPAPVPPPDLYLARTAAGTRPERVVAELRANRGDRAFSAATLADLRRQHQRTLTALNLNGLSGIEAGAATVIAGAGVGVLGAFLAFERRREFAVLRSVGATTRQVVTGPAVEGLVTAVGSVLIGIPVGVGLAVVAVRVLGLFFTLPPPVLSLPVGALALLGTTVLLASGAALALALRRVSRLEVAALLREP